MTSDPAGEGGALDEESDVDVGREGGMLNGAMILSVGGGAWAALGVALGLDFSRAVGCVASRFSGSGI